MALRISGIDLVLKNYQGFIDGLTRGGKASDQFDKTIARLQQRVERMTRAWSAASRSQENAVSRVAIAYNNLVKAENRYSDAQKNLLRIQANAKSTAAQIERAQRDLTESQLNLTNAYEQYFVAANNANSANVKLQTSFEQLRETQEELARTQAAGIGSMDGLVDILSGIIPMGGQVVGALGAIGVSGGTLIPILLAVGAAFTTAKVAAALFQGMIKAVQFAISTLMTVARGIGSVVVGAFRLLGSVIERVTRPLRTFLQHVLEIASGIALWRAIRNVGEMIREVASEVFNAVAAFQTLEIRLDSLIARDVSKNMLIPMAEAFEKTAGASAELFDWMRRLAIATPFSVQDVAQFFTMSTAMGITIAKTKELTEATTNFAAGMGLSGEIMERIIYNFGQMIQRGKLSGEEFRDLARNFVPIDIIMKRMAERAGMTTVAFREMALEGGVPVMEFINEFIDIAMTDFPDAAQRMTRTWAGIVERVQDFIQAFIGFDIIKPVLDRFTSSVSDAFEKMTADPQLSRSTKFLGQVLLALFERLTPVVDDLMNSIGFLFRTLSAGVEPVREVRGEMFKMGEAGDKIAGWARTVAVVIATVIETIKRVITNISNRIRDFASDQSPLATLADKAKTWGLNFIKSFSAGVAGGIRLLTLVIKAIAGVLSFFFKPGSPPRIAPDIDEWGADTMMEWLKGFTQADFDAFGDLSGLVEEFLRSITDQIGAENLVPQILQAREQIAGAFAGMTGGNIFGAGGIDFGGMGNISALFQDYLDTLMRIADAQGIVDQASGEVRRAQEAVDRARAAFDAFDESLFGVAAAEQAVADASARVEAIQNQITAATERYESVLNSLQSQLTEVTTEYDEELRLREIAAAFATERLTAEERERLEMERRGIELRREIRGVEDERDAEIARLRAELSEAQQSEDAARARLEAIKTQVEAERELLQIQIDQAERALDAAQARLDAAEAARDIAEGQADAIRSQIELIIEQNRLIKEQKDLLAELAAGVEQGMEETFEMPEVAENVEDFLKEIDAIIAEAEKNADALFALLGDMGAAWTEGGAPQAIEDLKNAFKDLGNVLGPWTGDEGIIAKLTGHWKDFRKWLGVPEGEDFITWLGGKLEEWGGRIKTRAGEIRDAGNLLFEGALGMLKMAALVMSPLFAGIPQAFSDFFHGSIDFLTGTIMLAAGVERLRKVSPEFKISTDLIGAGVGALVLSYALLNPVVAPLALAWIALSNAFKAAAGIFKLAGALWKDFSETMLGIMDAMANALKEHPELNILDLLWMITRDVIAPGLADIFGPMLKPGGLGLGGFAAGGMTTKGKPIIVGERGPELFVPKQSGMVVPNTNRMIEQMMTRMSAAPVSAPPVLAGGNTDRSINIEINPSYSQTQSEASIFYDITAALSMVGR